MADHQTLLLLAENEFLVGLDLQEVFQDAGYCVAGPFASSKASLKYLNEFRPDVALIDNMLEDGVCYILGKTLYDSDIPFAVYSGHPRQRADPRWSEFPSAPWIDKPCPFHKLLTVLEDLVPMKHRRTG